jgi:hypoxanthine phosphoribosyltransferase
MVLAPVIEVLDLTFVPFISHSQIQLRVREIGTAINQSFEDKVPVFIPILNGGFMFAADLLKEICIPCEVSFVKVASYQGESTGGEVKEVLGLNTDIKGRHIILVEDIVDTGLTMEKLVTIFMRMEPASLSIATLFIKPKAVKVELPITYKGFEIENKFIVGYGLDYNGQGRNFRDVYQKAD